MKHSAMGAAPQMVLSMLIFGSIGLIRNLIPLPSGFIAMLRGFIGAVCLLPFLLKDRAGVKRLLSCRRDMTVSLISGIFMGFNWILLFEAYRYTTVAIATLSYYFAPVLVILMTPVLTRTRLTAKQWICSLTALCGMVLLSGVLTDSSAGGNGKGIVLALLAACLYAAVMLLNRFYPSGEPFPGTVLRLGTAGLALIPYVCLRETVSFTGLSLKTVLLVLLLGVVHTGVAYLIYFHAVGKLSPLTTALMSYIDPVTAVLLSALVLKEPFGPLCALGMILLLGAMICMEINRKPLTRKE